MWCPRWVLLYLILILTLAKPHSVLVERGRHLGGSFKQADWTCSGHLQSRHTQTQTWSRQKRLQSLQKPFLSNVFFPYAFSPSPTVIFMNQLRKQECSLFLHDHSIVIKIRKLNIDITHNPYSLVTVVPIMSIKATPLPTTHIPGSSLGPHIACSCCSSLACFHRDLSFLHLSWPWHFGKYQ